MTPRLASVLTELDLPFQELQAAMLDGELYAIGDGYAPIDEQEQSRHRAQSLAALTVPRMIAERLTAAWIHGATEAPPRVHEFCVSHEARARGSATRRYSIREVVIPTAEIQQIGGIAVTTPLRTAIDLLRSDGDFDTDMATTLATLLRVTSLDLYSCRTAIDDRHKLAGKRRALARLTALQDCC